MLVSQIVAGGWIALSPTRTLLAADTLITVISRSFAGGIEQRRFEGNGFPFDPYGTFRVRANSI